LARSHPVAANKLLDGHVASVGEHAMVAGQLDVHGAVWVWLGRRKAHPEDSPTAQWGGVPPGHLAANEVSGLVNRHHVAGVLLADETADPLPGAVTQLNLCVVPEAL